jgi:apolipoprotein N-acyltransferase
MERLANSVILSWGWKRALIALLAGAIGALALPPLNIFAAMFVAFTLLVWLIDGAAGAPEGGWLARILPAFATGWLFGFGYFVAGLWWLASPLMAEPEFRWAIPLAVAGLPAFLALFYGLATALARLIWPDGIGRIAMLAVAFAVIEWLRSFVLTGFPWNAIGYTAMPIPIMMQPVRLIGVEGMTLLAVLVFAMPALLGTGKGARLGIALAAILLAADFGYGYWAMQRFAARPGKSEMTVRLVQPVTGLDEGVTDESRNAIFEKLIRLSTLPPQGAKKPDFIIWPETAIPFILTEKQEAFTRIAEMLGDGQTLIAGTVRAEDAGPASPKRYYNSAYVFDSDGQIVSAADKVHLVPFGEYMPFAETMRALGIDTIAALPGGYSAAVTPNLLSLPGGRQLYPLICYEAIFPDEIGPAAARASALINLTNDIWFGRTPGPYQHFHQAQVTAVELGLPMIRSANSGISAIIAADGQIISGATIYTSGVVDSTFTLKSVSSLNSSARVMNFWLLSVLIFLIAAFSRVSFIFHKN